MEVAYSFSYILYGTHLKVCSDHSNWFVIINARTLRILRPMKMLTVLQGRASEVIANPRSAHRIIYFDKAVSRERQDVCRFVAVVRILLLVLAGN